MDCNLWYARETATTKRCCVVGIRRSVLGCLGWGKKREEEENTHKNGQEGIRFCAGLRLDKREMHEYECSIGSGCIFESTAGVSVATLQFDMGRQSRNGSCLARELAW